jgi:hypothetical protein
MVFHRTITHVRNLRALREVARVRSLGAPRIQNQDPDTFARIRKELFPACELDSALLEFDRIVDSYVRHASACREFQFWRDDKLKHVGHANGKDWFDDERARFSEDEGRRTQDLNGHLL